MDRNLTIYNTDLDIKVLIGNITLNFFCINYEAPIPGWGYENHSHSSYELHLIPYGKGSLKVAGTTYKIKPGTFYVTGPGIFHEQKADYLDPMCEYCLNFEISNVSKEKISKTAKYLKSEVDDLIHTLLTNNFWFGQDLYENVKLFEKVIYELENTLVGYYSYLQSLLAQIIINAIRCYTPKTKSKYLIPKKILNDSRRHLVDKYFGELEQDLTRETLANIIGTSVRQLNRILHEYYQMNFKEKLNSSRLEKAKHLLLNTNLSSSDIAYKACFANPSYFNKVLRNIIKCLLVNFVPNIKNK